MMLIQKIHKEAIFHKEKLDSKTKSQSIHKKKRFQQASDSS
jgi:hypothetical protein